MNRRRKTEDGRPNFWIPSWEGQGVGFLKPEDGRPKTEDGRPNFWIPSWEGQGVGFLKPEDGRPKTEDLRYKTERL
jgi:hypothetical protein